MEGCKGIVSLVGMALLLSVCAPATRTSTSISARPPVATPAPAAADSPPAAAHAIPQDEILERLLAYAARSRAFDAERLAAEYAALSKAARRHPSAEARIRLAILLAHPHAPFRDDARARRLLRQAAGSDAGIGDLARLLRREVDARMDLARERAQRRELQQKLEQLKTIEQEIDRRVPTPVVPERQ